MNSIAVITARGGSKRIPRKNIRNFLGKPIIAYSIQTAIESKLFDMVMVSTDDDEIALIAKQYGATVPFLRTPETADDFSGTGVVMEEVLENLKRNNLHFTYACCIYPTAPFITVENLSTSYNLLKEKHYNSVFPVSAFCYPILRALKRNIDGKTEMIWPENLTKRSQDLEPAYHDAGQFYWLEVSSFLEEKKLFTSNSGTILLDEMQVQDIDNEIDWKLAEIKYKLLSAE